MHTPSVHHVRFDVNQLDVYSAPMPNTRSIFTTHRYIGARLPHASQRLVDARHETLAVALQIVNTFEICQNTHRRQSNNATRTVAVGISIRPYHLLYYFTFRLFYHREEEDDLVLF